MTTVSNVLLRLIRAGAHVKATGFPRVARNVPAALRRIHDANPDALLFGTDLPGTRAPRAFRAADIDLVRAALGPSGVAKILRDNALRLTGPRSGRADLRDAATTRLPPGWSAITRRLEVMIINRSMRGRRWPGRST